MPASTHNDSGGGYAAAEPDHAPRRIRGPHLQPQRSLTRSLTRRPTAAVDPGASTTPQPAHDAGRPTPAFSRAARTRPNYKITIIESLRFEGIANRFGHCVLLPAGHQPTF